MFSTEADSSTDNIQKVTRRSGLEKKMMLTVASFSKPEK